MNAFWVFVPGAVILLAGLLIFEWRNRKQPLRSAASTAEQSHEESNGPVG